MRKFRFFSERQNLRIGSSIKLNDFDANHVRKSLRLKKDDFIFIFNGVKEFKAKLKLVTNDVTMAQILEEVSEGTEEGAKITLFQALTKAKSFELIIEKVTELGINVIVPFESDFSVVKADYVKNKFERWNKIIISACKQSERIGVPELQNTITFDQILEKISGFDLVIAFSPNRGVTAEMYDLKQLSQNKFKKIAYIIGPEGGFSPAEISKIEQSNNIKIASLGHNILRAETAAIGALAILRQSS